MLGKKEAFAVALLICLSFQAAPPLRAAPDSILYEAQDLERYIEKWHRRDGAAASVISDFFLDFLGARPDVFFPVFRGYEIEFREWLADLADLSFVDHGTCVDLECRRQASIKSLETYQPGAEERVLYDRILVRLRQIVVRRID